MEIGKWIVFAFLLGAVIVGFKSKQLKAYEFIVCGAFAVLADGLVFDGAISRWLGDLGENARNAVSLGHLAPLATAGAMLPGSTPWLRRFGTALWKHKPGWWDLWVVAAGVALTAGFLRWSLWTVAATYVVALVTMVTLAALADPAMRKPTTATTPKRDDADGEDQGEVGR